MDNAKTMAELYAAATIRYQMILASLPDGYFPPDEDLRADMQKLALAMFGAGVEHGAAEAGRFVNKTDSGPGSIECM